MKDWIKEHTFVFLAYLAMFFASASHFLFWTGVLVILDLITGIAASKEHFISKKMRPSVLKGLGYMIAILVAQIAQNLISPDDPIVKGVFTLIIAIEAKSIDENIEKFTGFSVLRIFRKKYENALKNEE